MNYQGLYNYCTGQVKPKKDSKKDGEETSPVPSTPSATRLAAHAASKNPGMLRGTTPKMHGPESTIYQHQIRQQQWHYSLASLLWLWLGDTIGRPGTSLA